MYEWDEAKQQTNLSKHGVDFYDAIEHWSNLVVELPSAQNHHDEVRIVAIGEGKQRVLTIVYTWRGNNRRIISARKASKNERTYYQNQNR